MPQQGYQKLRFNKIEPQKALSCALASRFDIDRYLSLVPCRSPDVSTDVDYQHNFNGFYKVRRSKRWRECFFEIFQSLRFDDSLSMEKALRRIYAATGQVEFSFASKMLSTIDDGLPNWDSNVSNVLCRMALQPFPSKSGAPEKRIAASIECYEALKTFYRELLGCAEGKECIKAFDKALPQYSHISNIKKIDYLFWSLGSLPDS